MWGTLPKVAFLTFFIMYTTAHLRKKRTVFREPSP